MFPFDSVDNARRQQRKNRFSSRFRALMTGGCAPINNQFRYA